MLSSSKSLLLFILSNLLLSIVSASPGSSNGPFHGLFGDRFRGPADEDHKADLPIGLLEKGESRPAQSESRALILAPTTTPTPSLEEWTMRFSGGFIVALFTIGLMRRASVIFTRTKEPNPVIQFIAVYYVVGKGDDFLKDLM